MLNYWLEALCEPNVSQKTPERHENCKLDADEHLVFSLCLYRRLPLWYSAVPDTCVRRVHAQERRRGPRPQRRRTVGECSRAAG